jgi:AcrR family transcriptional regulator
VNRHNAAWLAIRAAAIEQFGRKGFEGTGIRDIAREVGLTPGALYHYIGSKEELLAAIMCDGTTRLIQEGTSAIASAPDSPADRLAALIAMHVRIHCEVQVEAQVSDYEIRSLAGANRKKVLTLRNRYEDLWRDVIAEGIEHGGFKVVDSTVCRLALIQMCTGVANWYRPDAPLSIDELVEVFVSLGFQTVGLATRGAKVVRIAPASAPAAKKVRRRPGGQGV